MMDRRAFIIVMGECILAAPLVAEGQQSSRPRIAFLLMGSSQAGLTSAFDAFREGLRELGWSENENIAIEYRWAEGQDDRLPSLATELVGLHPDVIVTTGTPGALDDSTDDRRSQSRYRGRP